MSEKNQRVWKPLKAYEDILFDYYNGIARITINRERYRNAFILYKKGMKPERVDSLCCTLDILPTLSNLFGLDFDSRLYMGRDVFSDAEPFVLLRDHSWITENAMYYAPLDELIMLQGDELTPEEVEERNQDVSNRFRASAWVLDQDYWRYLFGDNLPPDGEN